MLRPVQVLATRIGDRSEWATDVLTKRIRYPRGNLAQTVIIIPGKDVPAFMALPSELVRDEMRNHDLAQVAQMDRPGRADPGRAYQRTTLVPTAFHLGENLVRCADHPVALPWFRHLELLRKNIFSTDSRPFS